MGFPVSITDPNALLSAILPDPVFIGDIEVDVLSIEEKVDRWETATDPVERGLDITNTRYKLPDFVRIEGILTDFQFDPRAIGTTLLATGTFGYESWQDKKKRFEEQCNSDTLIEITTRLHFYRNMKSKLLRVTQDKDNATCYMFVLEAEEMRIVSSETVAVDPSLLPKELQDAETGTNTEGQKAARQKAGKSTNGGKVETPPATPKDVDPLRSLAQQLGFNV